MQTTARRHSRSVHIVALVMGIEGIAFGVYWGIIHAGEPEILSPTLLGFVGAALALNSGWRLMTYRGQPRSRNRS